MASGAAGRDGRPVPEHVALVRRNVPELALTHGQQMEAKIVREQQMKLENAAIEFAQVSYSSATLLFSRARDRRAHNKIYTSTTSQY